MGVIRRPQQFLAQPQYSPSLSPDYDDAEVLSLFNDGTGKDLARGNNLTYPADPPAKVLRQQGYALNFDGTNRLVTERDLTLPTAFTVFAWVRPDFINFSYSRIAETSFSTGFYLGSNNGNSGAAKYAWIVKGASLEGCIGGDQVVGQRDFVVGTYGNLTRKLYVNGVEVASAAAANPASPVSKVYVAHNSGGVNFWRGDIDTFGVYYRTFSAEEIWSLYQQPWTLVKAPPRRIFFSAAPSGVDLTGSTSTVANIASAGAITQSHVITGSASSQANASVSGAITQSHELVGANSTQGNVASAAAISQAGEFVGANCAQANSASTAAITQDHALTGSASTQPNLAGTGAVTLGVAINLAAAASTQGNSGSTAAITQAHVLIHAPSVQDNVAASSAIVQAHILAAANNAQGNMASEAEISLAGSPILSTVEATAIFRSTVARSTKFQRSKSATVKFN